jgi:dolichyl-phosphate beta-glucosyltransferase
MPDITLILPAFNEAKSITTTVAEVKQFFESRQLRFEIIVSADGTDGTREIVARLAETDARIRVIGQPERLGKGRGIREAVEIAQGQIIGFADADNKVPISEFDNLYRQFSKGFDIVIGSRGIDPSRVERKQPLYRQLGSKGFSVFMRAVVGLRKISDTQCGFKFFKRHVAKDLFRRQKIDGYMFDVEILALSEQLSYLIKEVPIRWRDDGDSRLQLLSGNLQNVADIFKIRRSLKQASQTRSVPLVSDSRSEIY